MRIFLYVMLILGSIVPANATTWYIRSDGGDLKQCTGQADVAYVAGGTNACALNDVRLLAFPGIGGYALTGKWIVQGGDTIHIGAGQFRVGYNGPGPNDHNGLASAGNPFASALPPVPSGTAGNPTRIIGAGVALTQLYGGYGAGSVLNLSGSSYVEISNLELTDHAQCTRVGGGYAAPVVGCSSSYPLDDYAANGISTNATTHDIKLSNLNIHGFTSDGIRGPIGGLITVDHVRIGFNGSAGWDFDDGQGTKSTEDALVAASYLTIEGSGCNEEYPIVHAGFPAFSCFDQSSGGYGDAVGTPNTPLSVTCDHCTFRYNTQDALDLLHSADSAIKVTSSTSYGNMGQQWKLGAMTTVDFEGNTTVHNCSRMSAPIAGNTTYNKYLSNFCRAAGDGFAIGTRDGGSYIFRNNSFAGYGATTYDMNCGGTGNIVFQNNLHIGYKQPVTGGQLPGIFYYGPGCSDASFKARDHNIYFNMRTSPSDGVNTDPHIAVEPAWVDETSLDAIDFHLTSASVNAKGQGADGVDIGFTGFAAASPSSGDTTAPPSSSASATTPSAATSTNYTINITLSCSLNGTDFICGPK
jgi:hypothetical protein